MNAYLLKADNRESQRTTCLEAGCDEFLSKPLDKACISLAKELMENAQRNIKFRNSNSSVVTSLSSASTGFQPITDSNSFHRNSK